MKKSFYLVMLILLLLTGCSNANVEEAAETAAPTEIVEVVEEEADIPESETGDNVKGVYIDETEFGFTINYSETEQMQFGIEHGDGMVILSNEDRIISIAGLGGQRDQEVDAFIISYLDSLFYGENSYTTGEFFNETINDLDWRGLHIEGELDGSSIIGKALTVYPFDNQYMFAIVFEFVNGEESLSPEIEEYFMKVLSGVEFFEVDYNF